MTDDRMQGKWDQAKGKIKEEAGRIGGDRSTETSGQLDQVKGRVEEGIGDAKEAVRRDPDQSR